MRNKSYSAILILLSLMVVSTGCEKEARDYETEIKKVIDDSFGWALTKDRNLFEGLFAKDESFFTYYPDSKNTVEGWSNFEKFLDNWMDPRSKTFAYEIRDLKLNISCNGDVAWFSAVVDDNGEWDDQPWSAEDIRWTGVLEKRNGHWLVVQQHMSEASDKVIERITEISE
ncbi:nuclear transport factor 2 family protein [Bacteroidota bacterium]